MNVRLPNGQVVANVPEGTTQKQLLDKLAQSGYDVAPLQRQIGPVATIGAEGLEQAAQEVGAEKDFMGQMGTGLGTAGQRIGTGLGQIAALLPGGRLSQASAKMLGMELPSQEQLDVAKATRTGAGRGALAADIAGSIAMTAPAPANMVGAGLSRLGTVGGTAATSGLIAGATTPGGLKERGKEAGLAAAFSTILPGITAMVQSGRRTATRAGRELAKTEALRRELGEEASTQLAGQLRAPYPNAPLGVTPTAAMKTQNPTLQALELGARTKRGDLFAATDEANALARWNEIQKIAKDDAALSAAEKVRNEATKPLRDAALNQASTDPWMYRPVYEHVNKLLVGKTRSADPSVQHMAKYVLGEINEGITPERLYSVRKVLTSAIPHGTDLGAAIKASRAERVALVSTIDDALDQASQGTWRTYLKTYADLSQPVTSMKAGQGIAETFQHTPARTTAATGSVPLMTPAALSRALGKHGVKEFGGKTLPRLTPDEFNTVKMVVDDLIRQQDVMKARGIIGSDTAAKIAAGSRGEAVAGALIGRAVDNALPVPMLGDLLGSSVTRGLARRREEALAEILKDPEKLADLLDAAARAQMILRTSAQSGRLARAPGD